MRQVLTPARQSTARWPMAGLSLTMLLPSLATSTANIALPDLARLFAASFQAAQWIVLSYLLAITALVVAAGRLGDIFGRRRLLLVGTALFASGSLLSGLAPGFELLIVARVVQGLGAAAMMALSMAFVSAVVPPQRTGSAMGLLGTMSAIGTTLGPALGGFLIASGGCRAIFLVNVPIAILAFLLTSRTLPADPPRDASTTLRFDLLGMVLLAAALTAFALAMTVGRGRFGWLNVAIFLAALTASLAFAAVEARVSSPLVRPSLLRDRALVIGLSANTVVSTVMMATLIVGPFYLTKGLGLEPAAAGLVLAIGPLVAAGAGVPAGRLVDRFGTHRAALAGLSALTVGAAALSVVPPAFGIAGYIVPVVAMTTGYCLFQAANNTAILTAARASDHGLVSGMLTLSRNLGLVTGASGMGAAFAWGTGAPDIVMASPLAIARGMHSAFVVAAAFLGMSLLVSLRSIRRAHSRVVVMTR